MRQVSIYKHMILLNGRSSLKQYNPQKTIKRGFKLWTMADMNRYLNKFEVYQGKGRKTTDETEPNHFG